MRSSPEGYVPARLSPARDRAGQAPAPRIAPGGPERFNDVPTAKRPRAPAALIWFGERPPEPPPMLIAGLLPQGQTAILAGVFSGGKTFVAADLAVSVMTGHPFAGREVLRRGAVLWLAAEGANEVDARIGAAAEARSGGNPVEALPFARQAFDVPRLTAPEAKEQILELAAAFKAGLAQRFPNAELVMVAIDTLGSAAGFADGNSSSEAQAVMNMLRAVNVATGALVLLIDHFGKAIETGVMGASAKAQSAEAILAVMSDKDGDGNHSNRRMTVAKLRGGPSGAVTPFKLRQVLIGGQDATTCVVDWSAPEMQAAAKPEKKAPNLTDVQKLALDALLTLVLDIGQPVPAAFNLPGVIRAVPVVKWCDELVRRGVLDLEDKNHRVVSKRIRDGLCVKGRAGQRDRLIWPL